MALRLSTGARNGLASTQGLKDLFNGGTLKIYSGGQPAAADGVETGTLLVTISPTNFGTQANGALPKSADTWSGVVSAAGVAGYFRLYGTAASTGTSGTAIRIDGNVGVSGSDMEMSPTTLTVGRTHTVDTFTLTVPES